MVLVHCLARIWILPGSRITANALLRAIRTRPVSLTLYLHKAFAAPVQSFTVTACRITSVSRYATKENGAPASEGMKSGLQYHGNSWQKRACTAANLHDHISASSPGEVIICLNVGRDWRKHTAAASLRPARSIFRPQISSNQSNSTQAPEVGSPRDIASTRHSVNSVLLQIENLRRVASTNSTWLLPICTYRVTGKCG
jgi:hypothetical protein